MPVVGIRSLKRTVVLLHSTELVEELSFEEFLARKPDFFNEREKEIFLGLMVVNDREYVWRHPYRGYYAWEHSLYDAKQALEESLEDEID